MKNWTDKAVRAARVDRHAIGGGLYLEVRDARGGDKRRSWLFRYQMDGKRRAQGLGSYPEISLADARQRAAEARVCVAKGVDPVEARKAAQQAQKPVPTFGEIAALVIADAQAKSTNAKVRYQWERHLGTAYSSPLLARPVNEITSLDVAAVLRPIWRTKPEVARKVYPAIRRVFDRARVILRDGHSIEISRNPADWSDLKAQGFETPSAADKRPPVITAIRPNARVHGRSALPRCAYGPRAGVPHLDRRAHGRRPQSDVGSVRY